MNLYASGPANIKKVQWRIFLRISGCLLPVGSFETFFSVYLSIAPKEGLALLPSGIE